MLYFPLLPPSEQNIWQLLLHSLWAILHISTFRAIRTFEYGVMLMPD